MSKHQHGIGVGLVENAITAGVNWGVEDGFLATLPCFELYSAGGHTLKTSVLLSPGDLRSLAGMLTKAADAYDSDREAEEAEIERIRSECKHPKLAKDALSRKCPDCGGSFYWRNDREWEES